MLSKAAMGRVLVVGSGLTGATTACILSEQIPPENITIWEKSRGAGGRMSTSRSMKDSTCTADLGAQYISVTPKELSIHKKFYDDLQQSHVIKPIQGVIDGQMDKVDGTKHFTSPEGISSVVKYFLKKSGAVTTMNQTVKSINISEENKWKVSTDTGKTETFDSIILTIPIPQILALDGTISTILASHPDVKQRMEAVSYSSRFSMGLFFGPQTTLDYSWAAKYITDSEIIRFISIDQKKRSIESSGGTSLVIHTSVPFGIKHLEESKEDVCKDIVLPELQRLLPDLPDDFEMKPHKWRYSQVSTPYENSPGAVVLQQSPLLIAGGDGFSRSGFNGCLESAQEISNHFNKYAS